MKKRIISILLALSMTVSAGAAVLSSSGGFGQEVMRAVLRSGGSVAACKFESGEFKFELFDDELRIAEFMGGEK